MTTDPAAGASEANPDAFAFDREVRLSDEAWTFNNAPWDQQKVVTVGDYQYVPYWDGDGTLSLARRDLTDDAVQHVRFDRTVQDEDSHRNTALGVDAEGRLHLAYDHHDDPFHYRYSAPGFVTDPPASASPSDFSPETDMGLSSPEAPVTYPRFFTDQNGELYCAYRLGSSGDGDTYLHVHDAASNAWTRVGAVFSREGTYDAWDGSTSRSAYCHDWTFDDGSRLHVTWTWRETWETWRSNHGLHYAYSDDGGDTWCDNGGARIADVSADDPITVDDDTAVVEASVDSWLINQGTQALDAAGQPHVFTSRSTDVTPDRDDANRHYVHYWRTPDGQWHEQFVDDPSVDLAADAAVEPTRDADVLLDRGDLLFDANDDLHVYVAVDGRLYGAVATAASGWSDWTIYLLDEGPVRGMDGRKHDEYRWERDGVLSIPLERPNGNGGSAFALADYELRNPSAPDDPELSVTRESPSIVELNWSGARGATRYTVFRRPVDGLFSAVERGVGRGSFHTSYVDEDVADDAAYEYVVQAVNDAGRSDSNVAGVAKWSSS